MGKFMKRAGRGRGTPSGRVLLAAATVLMLAATGCGGGEDGSAEETETERGADPTPTETSADAESPAEAPDVSAEVITVASAAIAPRAGIDIAIEKGYFADEALEIEITDVGTGPDQVPLMSSGQVDVAVTGPAATHYNALAGGVPVRFVAPCGSSSADGEVPNSILSVRKDLYDSGEITSVEDLKPGHKMGIPNEQSKGYVDATQYAALAGLTVDDLELVAPLSFPDTANALASGAIDVGQLVEPFATFGEMNDESVVIGGDHLIMPRRLGCAIAFGSRLIEDQELGDRFMRAYLRGVRDYHEAFFKDQGMEEVAQIMASAYAVDDPGLYDQLIPNYIDPNGEINRESLELDISVYTEKGLLSEEPDIDNILDTGYAERAVEELGRYETG